MSNVRPPMNRLLVALAAFSVSLSAVAGAWGDGSFDNDDALDWVSQCTKSGEAKLVAATLNKALSSGEIDAADGASIVAAVEVVAAANGKPSPNLPSELRSWLERQPRGEITQLVPLAK